LADDFLYARRNSGLNIDRIKSVFGGKFKEEHNNRETIYVYTGKVTDKCPAESAPPQIITEVMNLKIHFMPDGSLYSWQLDMNGQPIGKEIKTIDY